MNTINKTQMRCSNCLIKFEHFKPLNDKKSARPGTVNVCSNCGQVCKFDKDMKLVIMQGIDILELEASNPKVYHVIVEAVDLIMQRVKLN